jgi:N-acetylglucosamine malate deacetylase 2
MERLFKQGGQEAEIALVVAHPDDEVIGAGAQLGRWPKAHYVHVTDGSPRDLWDGKACGCRTREEYAERRRQEHAMMLERVGADRERTWELGYADQETCFHLVNLTGRLKEWLNRMRPEVVLTHPYEGGHPDHDGTAFAVHAAVRCLREEGDWKPVLVEMTSYHAWDGRIRTGEFLPGKNKAVVSRYLTGAEREGKRRLFGCYETQEKVLRDFTVEVERFRLAPSYDFSGRPHEGPLYYERFNWGMSWSCWKGLVREAERELGFGR